MRSKLATAVVAGTYVALAVFVAVGSGWSDEARRSAGKTLASLVGLPRLSILTDRVGMVCTLALGVALLAAALRPQLWKRPPRGVFPALLSAVVLLATLNVMARRLAGHPYHDYGDNYHYVLGAKYFEELSYTDLYLCTATAMHDLGIKPPRRMRNLSTNRVEHTRRTVDRHVRGACRSRFTPARWEAFKADIEVFHGYHSEAGMQRRLHDHGYNGTPFWTVVSRAVSGLVPADAGGYDLLAALNVVLLGIGAASLVYAFGWELGLVALVLFWVCYPDRFLHAGAHLRYLWMGSMMVAFSLLRCERPALSGAVLGLCAALLIFPGLLLVPAGIALAAAIVRRRRLPTVHLRFVVGGSLALAAALLVSAMQAGGPGSWLAFLDQMELNSGRLATGRIGFIYNFLFPKSWDVRAPNYLAQLSELRRPLLLGLSLDHLRIALAGVLSVGVLRVALHRNLLTATALGGFSLLFLWLSTVRYYYAGMLGLPLMWHALAGTRRASLFLGALALLHGTCYLVDNVAAYPFVYNTVLVSGFTLAVIVAPRWLAVPRSQAHSASVHLGERSAKSGAYQPVTDAS